MRLVTLLLSAAVAAAAQTIPNPQTLPKLPWAGARTLPWTPCDSAAARPDPPPPAPAELTLTVTLSEDGALRVTDDKGVIQMRLGLPGRVLKLWRDGGTPVAAATRALSFPAHTPLQEGIAGMGLGSPDFRPALAGLLWVLDDDERVLTVVHPATHRVAYLPLPGGRDITLAFNADRLEIHKALPGPRPHLDDSCWSLPWLALLPQLVQLGQAQPPPLKAGTALIPFPKE